MNHRLWPASAALCALLGTVGAGGAHAASGPASQTLQYVSPGGNYLPAQGVQIIGKGPSAAAPVTFSLTAASASASFIPIAGRAFHLVIPAGTGAATCYPERQPDGINWVPPTVAGTPFPVLNYTGAALSEDLYEDQSGVPWRLDCGAALGGFSSGTIAGSFTQ